MDGSLLYAEGSVNVSRQLVWVDRTGKEIEAVGSPHMGLAGPRLSPDGRRVAFSAADGGNRDVWVLDLMTGIETRLTFGPQSESSPEWMASSSRLAYIEHDEMQARVLSIHADGSGAQRTFAPRTYFVPSAGSVTVAPDGKSAIRVVDQRGHGSLQVGPILPDGSLGTLKPLLTRTPEPSISDARISPDGHLLAYQTNDAGIVNVFLTRYPGGEGQWQVGTEGGFSPRWARDRGELFFVAGSGPSSRSMVSADVEPSRDPPLGALTRLFRLSGDNRGSDFDVSADGRILLTRPSGGADPSAGRMVLVQNWRSGLEKSRGR
jgi:Tol biopolymer transport system component